eukprot:4455132-Pyramimonas_sp.AAC.1
MGVSPGCSSSSWAPLAGPATLGLHWPGCVGLHQDAKALRLATPALPVCFTGVWTRSSSNERPGASLRNKSIAGALSLRMHGLSGTKRGEHQLDNGFRLAAPAWPVCLPGV